MVHDDVQVDARAPAQRGFAALRQTTKHTLLPNPAVVADRERGGVHNRAAGPTAITGRAVGPH